MEARNNSDDSTISSITQGSEFQSRSSSGSDSKSSYTSESENNQSISQSNDYIDNYNKPKKSNINIDISYLIPSLLEHPEIKCNEFEKRVDILIDGLQEEINNINQKDLPVELDKHIDNTKNLILSMYSCINCIIQNINSEEVTDCLKDIDEEQSDISTDDNTKSYTIYDN